MTSFPAALTMPGLGANESLLESWALSLHAKRPRTVVVYLRELARFAEATGLDLTAVTKQDVQRWVRSEQQRAMKASTIRNRFTAVQAFYRWALDEGEVAANPCAGVTVPRGHEPAPKVLAPDQVVALLKACDGTRFRDRRDAAMLRLMLATGLRVSECASLELADLDLQARIAAVRNGKGGRSRVVRFDPATAAALDRYRRVRGRHRYAASSALWVGQVGALTPSGVTQALEDRAAKAGIGHVHPHQLRHTWADRWLGAGGTEGDLLRLGGWRSAEVMRRYGESRAVDRALDAYDTVDPMRGL